MTIRRFAACRGRKRQTPNAKHQTSNDLLHRWRNLWRLAFSVWRLVFLFAGITAFLTTALSAPPVGLSLTVDPLEPDENGSFVYARIASTGGNSLVTGRFFVRARIANNSGATQTLTRVQTILYGAGPNIVRDYARDLDIPNNAVRESGFEAGEVIVLTLPAPPAALVAYYFEGYPNDPIIVNRGLAAYTPLGGSYIYPADEGDIGPDEYFSGGIGIHLAPNGQLWGTDWHVYRITAAGTHTTLRAGGDPETNEGSLGWGVPIRALAAGTVLRTSTGWITNPRPGERAFQLMEEYDGEQIADVKTTTLSATRAATLQRLPSAQVQLSVWDITDTGRNIVRLGSDAVVAGENVSAMAIDALSATRVIGILRLSGTNNRRMVVWDITDDPFTITRHDTDTGSATEVAIMAMDEDTNRFATASRNAAGNLEVTVWEVDAGGGCDALDSETGEAATSVCLSALSATRIAASFRTAGGLLKNIVWDYDEDTSSLTLRDTDTGEAITRVVTSVAQSENWPRKKWVTAFRTPGGMLKLIRWNASGGGTILAPELETLTTVAIQDTSLAVAPATGSDGADSATTTSILGDGTFKINGWGDPDVLPSTYETSAQNTAGTVSRVSLDELSGTDYVAAVRTAGGALKLMTWHWAGGGGNNVVVLHGDCRVLYAHFQENSVDTSVLYPGAPVAAGQVLGRMGNSGASGGPHTHIHADRIYPMSSIPELVALEADGALPLIGSRPIPFTGARAMSIADIVQGGDNPDNPANPFATMNGGMYDVQLGIRPRLLTRYVDYENTAQDRDGLKEPVPGVFPQPTTGGPARTVGGVLSLSPSGTRLYIRGGNYDETLIFNTPMTVRRYDYFDRVPGVFDGPAIIGK